MDDLAHFLPVKQFKTWLTFNVLDDFDMMLTITGESYRLLRFRDFDGNFDRVAVVPSTVPLGDDGAEDEARVGRNVIMWKFGAQTAGGSRKRKQQKESCFLMGGGGCQ